MTTAISIIRKMEKMRARYVEKWATEPVVFSIDEDDGKLRILLCRKIIRVPRSLGGGRMAEKPYLRFTVRYSRGW